MGLFKKKSNQQTEEPRIINVKCPKCGKMHELMLHHTKYLLDGTPALPMTKLLERIHVCDCGMLITPVEYSIVIMNNPRYTEGLSQSDPILRKLDLLISATGDLSALTYYAQYYNEIGDADKEKQALLRAIEALESGKDRMTLIVPANQFSSLHTNYPMHQYVEDRLIDLYRRTKQYEKAKILIKQRREKQYPLTPHEIFAFLSLEEKFMRQNNSSAK